MTRWIVMAEFGGEDNGHARVYRVRRWWLFRWWLVATFNVEAEAIDYAERAAAADVPPERVWP